MRLENHLEEKMYIHESKYLDQLKRQILLDGIKKKIKLAFLNKEDRDQNAKKADATYNG